MVDKSTLASVPKGPGVYLMKDAKGRIIYVGKAKNLRARLRQWFSEKQPLTTWGTLMLQRVESFDYVLTDSEVEALALESNLIKHHKPQYNVMLMDDKQYPFLRLGLDEDFPSLTVVRRVKNDGARYFGPYPEVGAMRRTLKLVHRLFKFRPCRRDVGKLRADRHHRPCLYYHLGQCLAPCRPEVSKQAYAEVVRQTISFLEGRQTKLVNRLRKQMEQAAEALEFERAARLRDVLRDVEKALAEQKAISTTFNEANLLVVAPGEPALVLVMFFRFGKLVGEDSFHLQADEHRDEGEILAEFIKQHYGRAAYVPKLLLLQAPPNDRAVLAEWLTRLRGSKVELIVPVRGEKRRLIELAERNAAELQAREREQRKREEERAALALSELQRLLELPAAPRRIETYDISNISGLHSTGSMVVFLDGRPAPAHYRKFNLRGDYDRPDDYARMEELLLRRLARLDSKEPSFGQRPDLLVIDGGKGQLNVALRALRKLDLDLPVISLAKRFEEVFAPGRSRPLALSEGGPAHLLLQRMRDEAHRFAITQHRTVRSRRTWQMELESIEGIGRVRLRKLLAHFGTVEALSKASLPELARAPGMNRKVALQVYFHFHPEEAPNEN